SVVQHITSAGATMSDSSPSPGTAWSAEKVDPSGAEIEFEYVWHEGSVPPPHHYWFSIKGWTGGNGQIVFVPGYPFEAPPQWVQPFPIAPERAAALKAWVRGQRIVERPWQESPSLMVGGSHRAFSLCRGDRQVQVPTQLSADDARLADELAGQIQALVPETIWRDLRERHAAHVQSCCR
ncbi:MAG TPA: hypothetical protein PKZ67_00785, partial [Accumulibacter sp.]|nr:hypothetical protein [Accumulibacter sp.]